MKKFSKQIPISRDTDQPFNPYGLKLFVISGVFLLLYAFTFSDSVYETRNYAKDVCQINSMEILSVNVDCKSADGHIFIVNMPCVLVHVNTTLFSHIRLFRSYEEKAWVLENDANVM